MLAKYRAYVYANPATCGIVNGFVQEAKNFSFDAGLVNILNTVQNYINENKISWKLASACEGICNNPSTYNYIAKVGVEKVTALIEVRVTPQRGMGFDNVAKMIYEYPEVNSVYLISGGFDLMVTIEGMTLKEVSSFVSDKLSPMESVLSTKTNFILKRYKDHRIIMTEEKEDEREMVSF